MKKEDMERYSVWYKVNNLISGPYFFISIVYIILYAMLVVLYLLMPEDMDMYRVYYIIGFPIFLFTLYGAYVGLLMRDAKR